MPITGISGPNYYTPLPTTVNSSQSQGGTDLQQQHTQVQPVIVPNTKIKSVDEINTIISDADAKLGTLLNVTA